MPDTPHTDTAVARMQARAEILSADYPQHTAARVVDTKADEIVEAARRGEAVEYFGSAVRTRAERFVLGSGPYCDVTVVFSDGTVDYAVIDYSEGAARAFRVIADRDAELLYEALRNYRN